MRNTNRGSLAGETIAPQLPLGVLVRRWLVVILATAVFGAGLSAVAGSFQSAEAPTAPETSQVADSVDASAATQEIPISTTPSPSSDVTRSAAASTTSPTTTGAPAPTTEAPASTTTSQDTTPAVDETLPPDTDSSIPATTVAPAATTTTPAPTTTTTVTPATTTTTAPVTTTTAAPTTTTTAGPTTTTTVAPAAPASGDTAFASSLVSLANKARASEGIAPLSVSSSLTSYAQDWAAHLADTLTLSHSNIGSLLGAWSTVGENVAAGHSSAQVMHTAWMNSAGHRANILNPNFTHIGVGVVIDANGAPRGVQVFGG